MYKIWLPHAAPRNEAMPHGPRLFVICPKTCAGQLVANKRLWNMQGSWLCVFTVVWFTLWTSRNEGCASPMRFTDSQRTPKLYIEVSWNGGTPSHHPFYFRIVHHKPPNSLSRGVSRRRPWICCFLLVLFVFFWFVCLINDHNHWWGLHV